MKMAGLQGLLKIACQHCEYTRIHDDGMNPQRRAMPDSAGSVALVACGQRDPCQPCDHIETLLFQSARRREAHESFDYYLPGRVDHGYPYYPHTGKC